MEILVVRRPAVGCIAWLDGWLCIEDGRENRIAEKDDENKQKPSFEVRLECCERGIVIVVGREQPRQHPKVVAISWRTKSPCQILPSLVVMCLQVGEKRAATQVVKQYNGQPSAEGVSDCEM